MWFLHVYNYIVYTLYACVFTLALQSYFQEYWEGLHWQSQKKTALLRWSMT